MWEETRDPAEKLTRQRLPCYGPFKVRTGQAHIDQLDFKSVAHFRTNKNTGYPRDSPIFSDVHDGSVRRNSYSPPTRAVPGKNWNKSSGMAGSGTSMMSDFEITFTAACKSRTRNVLSVSRRIPCSIADMAMSSGESGEGWIATKAKRFPLHAPSTVDARSTSRPVTLLRSFCVRSRSFCASGPAPGDRVTA